MQVRTLRTIVAGRPALVAPRTSTVAEAARVMKQRDVGSLLVVDGTRLVGIFTERDVAFRVVAAGLDPDATTLREVMTRRPLTIGPEQPFGYALALMHEKGFRHLPVLDRGKVVGLVSARSAMDPDLEEFRAEAHRRERYQR